MWPAASTEQEALVLESTAFLPAEADAWVEGGRGPAAPALQPPWFRRARAAVRDSIWFPVALKLAGLLLGVLVLSGVGIASISSTGSTVSLAGMLGSDIHAAWLASSPDPSAKSAAAPTAQAPPNAPTAAAKKQHQESAGGTATTASSGTTQDGKVILNLASAEELRHLPGVGQKRADAILALRVRLGGRFKHVSDLLRVKGIGVRGLKKLLPHVVLDAPAAPAV